MVDHQTRLMMDIRAGERVVLDGRRITINLLDKSGKVARLQICAPRDVSIEHVGADGAPPSKRDKVGP